MEGPTSLIFCLFLPVLVAIAIVVVPIYLCAIAAFVIMPAGSIFALGVTTLERLLDRFGPLTRRQRLVLLAIFNLSVLLLILAIGTYLECQPLPVVAIMAVALMILVNAILVLGLEHVPTPPRRASTTSPGDDLLDVQSAGPKPGSHDDGRDNRDH